jgi:hypothetical protein
MDNITVNKITTIMTKREIKLLQVTELLKEIYENDLTTKESIEFITGDLREYLIYERPVDNN